MGLDRFVDLDELVLECRTANARRYIGEAVACYRAGAFRACVVVTWIAVVYDIIEKFRELALTGDKNAEQKMAQFDKIVAASDIVAVLAFERSLLDVARNSFELLSEVEHAALKRLQEDRNRCAHPTFFGSGEIYIPSPELARSHIRSAVEYLLQYPPMQGKAALERVISEVSSEYFPGEKDGAVQILRGGPLAQARPALVRNLLIVLLKQLLFGELPRPEHIRRSVAARAVIEMHPKTSHSTLAEKVNAILLSLEDKHLMRGVATVYRVPEIREFLLIDVKTKLRSYIANVAEDSLVQMYAAVMEIDFLAPEGLGRIPNFSRDAVAKLAALRPPVLVPELSQRVVDLYESSVSFGQANSMAAAVTNVIGSLDVGAVERVMRACSNGQVRYSGGFNSVLEAIKASGLVPLVRFQDLMAELDLANEHPDLVQTTKLASEPSDPFIGTPTDGGAANGPIAFVPAPLSIG
jgi:hypothetical protein